MRKTTKQHGETVRTRQKRSPHRLRNVTFRGSARLSFPPTNAADSIPIVGRATSRTNNGCSWMWADRSGGRTIIRRSEVRRLFRPPAALGTEHTTTTQVSPGVDLSSVTRNPGLVRLVQIVDPCGGDNWPGDRRMMADVTGTYVWDNPLPQTNHVGLHCQHPQDTAR